MWQDNLIKIPISLGDKWQTICIESTVKLTKVTRKVTHLLILMSIVVFPDHTHLLFLNFKQQVACLSDWFYQN